MLVVGERERLIVALEVLLGSRGERVFKVVAVPIEVVVGHSVDEKIAEVDPTREGEGDMVAKNVGLIDPVAVPLEGRETVKLADTLDTPVKEEPRLGDPVLVPHNEGETRAVVEKEATPELWGEGVLSWGVVVPLPHSVAAQNREGDTDKVKPSEGEFKETEADAKLLGEIMLELVPL
jgi:hypothetical protein